MKLTNTKIVRKPERMMFSSMDTLPTALGLGLSEGAQTHERGEHHQVKVEHMKKYNDYLKKQRLER